MSTENITETKQNITEFVEENLESILSNLRPDLIFEYFSKSEIDWNRDNSWNIKISNNSELLGEYEKSELVAGKWFDGNNEQIKISELHKKLKIKHQKLNIPFSLFLNKLLCKGKSNGGISWNEYHEILYIERDVEILGEKI